MQQSGLNPNGVIIVLAALLVLTSSIGLWGGADAREEGSRMYTRNADGTLVSAAGTADNSLTWGVYVLRNSGRVRATTMLADGEMTHTRCGVRQWSAGQVVYREPGECLKVLGAEDFALLYKAAP